MAHEKKYNPIDQNWEIIAHNIVYIIGSLFLIGVGISLVYYYSQWYIFIICFGIIASIVTTI